MKGLHPHLLAGRLHASWTHPICERDNGDMPAAHEPMIRWWEYPDKTSVRACNATRDRQLWYSAIRGDIMMISTYRWPCVAPKLTPGVCGTQEVGRILSGNPLRPKIDIIFPYATRGTPVVDLTIVIECPKRRIPVYKVCNVVIIWVLVWIPCLQNACVKG
jgi:hypothetical protein